MKHKEQNLQIKCVRWFRIQHPAFAKLLFHPKNESTTANARRIGGIAKAEGVVAGVADLILLIPSKCPSEPRPVCCAPTATFFSALAIEMKTESGRQSPEQRTWQQYFEHAGGRYVIIRSFDEFVDVVNRYVCNVPDGLRSAMIFCHANIEHQKEAADKARLQKLLSKQSS